MMYMSGPMGVREDSRHDTGCISIWGVPKRKQGGTCVAIDFWKAYDSVSDSPMRGTLRYFGLPEAYVSLLLAVMHGPILFCVWRSHASDVRPLHPAFSLAQKSVLGSQVQALWPGRVLMHFAVILICQHFWNVCTWDPKTLFLRPKRQTVVSSHPKEGESFFEPPPPPNAPLWYLP